MCPIEWHQYRWPEVIIIIIYLDQATWPIHTHTAAAAAEVRRVRR